MKVNKALAHDAAKHNICQDWYDDLLRTHDKGQLLKMYLKGIDFCLSNDYPTNSFIRENFKGEMEQYGIYLDDTIKSDNSRYVVALGNCIGTASYTGFEVGQVFVKHTSRLKVTASGNSFLMVDIFDDAKLEVEVSDSAKICINQYGGNITRCSEPDNGIIKIVRKSSKTY